MEKRSQYWLSVLYIRGNDGLKGCNMDWTCFGDKTCCVTCILPVIGSIISLLSHFEFISLVPCYDDPVDPVEHCLELPKVVDMEGRTEMIDEFVLITIALLLLLYPMAVSSSVCLMLRYSMWCGCCTPSYAGLAVPDDCKCGIVLPYTRNCARRCRACPYFLPAYSNANC